MFLGYRETDMLLPTMAIRLIQLMSRHMAYIDSQ